MTDDKIVQKLLDRVFGLKHYPEDRTFVHRGDAYTVAYIVQKVRDKGIDKVVDMLENPRLG